MVFFELRKKHEQLTDIHLVIGSSLTSNIYLLGKREITLIDTDNDFQPNAVITELKKTHLNINNIAQILITHTHFDHVSGLTELVRHVSPSACITPSSIFSYLFETPKFISLDTSRLW